MFGIVLLLYLLWETWATRVSLCEGANLIKLCVASTKVCGGYLVFFAWVDGYKRKRKVFPMIIFWPFLCRKASRKRCVWSKWEDVCVKETIGDIVWFVVHGRAGLYCLICDKVLFIFWNFDKMLLRKYNIVSKNKILSRLWFTFFVYGFAWIWYCDFLWVSVYGFHFLAMFAGFEKQGILEKASRKRFVWSKWKEAHIEKTIFHIVSFVAHHFWEAILFYLW